MTGLLPQSWWPSWQLFGETIVVGLLLGAVLPLCGTVLVLRQQMFVAAAIGQAANLGIAVVIALGLGSAHAGGHAHGELPALGGGLLFAMAAAVAAMRALSRGASTLEASSVWTFLAGGSLSVVLLADAPHGLSEVQRLMLSSLLCVGPGDVWVAGCAAVVVVLAVLLWRRRLVAWAMDPASARAYGARVAGYDVVVGGLVGAVLGWSIHSTGLVFTFACTVLPVLAAREVGGSLRAVAVSAPLIGVAAVAGGLALGNRCDLPAGQTSATVLVAVAAAAAGAVRAGRRLRRFR